MDTLTSALSHLECPECGKKFGADEIQTYCVDCRSPLLARYELDSARRTLTRAALSARPRGIWRWSEILPARAAASRLTLGEGGTPTLRAENLGRALGLENLYLKDEASNPGGSAKARGLAVAIARALEFGLRRFVIAAPDRAGEALAAYAARRRIQARVYLPKDASPSRQAAIRAAGAQLVLVDEFVPEAEQLATKDAQTNRWFDLSAFREPYACEGAKTLGFELAESFGWTLPDVIIQPTSSGWSLVGMWKAFDELEVLGWIGPERPRMVSVQAEGCAPVARAFDGNNSRAQFWDKVQTVIPGLKVPSVFADRLVLRVIRESNGIALAVPDDEILAGQQEMAHSEGILASPKGGASLAALKRLLAEGWLKPDERVVLCNPGSGLKDL